MIDDWDTADVNDNPAMNSFATTPDAVQLELMTPGHGALLDRLWQLYWHDLSEFRGVVPSSDGTFKAFDSASFLGTDQTRHGYLLRRAADVAGFVLIHSGGASSDRSVREFFVVRGLRRHGVGAEAATAVLTAEPGRWEIAFQEENGGAARFWRRVAASVTVGPVTEELVPVPGKPWIPPDVMLRLTT